ncbi:CoA transferase [Rhodococcus sp. T2V]|uniref:CoA transferase n=1 Tax=Rhodococcus sp. T2V TaxID=3034164 RepID=UPI0023E25E74|nr:CoA transferase [Rhodococcus sp. T2V]MDF3311149.1 CoA transferase [Rhodococcus sp. T2V]
MKPLKGIRVLDLTTGLAGRLGSGLLAEFGADVVRVTPDASIAADANRPDLVFADHAKSFVEPTAAHSTDDTEHSDFDVCFVDDISDAHTAASTHTIVTVTPPYTSDYTPWNGGAESPELLHAFTGLSAIQASYSGNPVAHVYPYVTITQAIWAATCTTAALIERERSGKGQTIEVSGAHAANIFLGYLYAREEGLPTPSRAIGPGGLNALYTRYRAADGKWFFVGALGPKFGLATLEATGSTHLLDDERVGGRLDGLWTPTNYEWAQRYFTELFASKSAEDWISILEAADIPCTLLQTREEWFAGEQIAAIGMVRNIDHSRLGSVRLPNVPITSVHRRAGDPAPPAAGNGNGPLDGVRVASLGTFVAGPYAAALLAELGADVIKVEPPSGDPWRMTGFIFNRGTRSLAIDLSTDEGRAALSEVVADVDVVVNNFRLGVMNRLGLGSDRLASLNPRAISLGVTAYGESGPLAALPGYDTVLQAAAGTMIAQGGEAEPVVLSVPVNDHTTAVIGAFTAVLGLLDRTRFGHVRQLSTSLAGTAAFLQLSALTEYTTRPAPPVGGRDFAGPNPADYIYSTKDGFVRVQAVDRETGINPSTFESEIASRNTAEALCWCASHDIPAVPTRTAREIAADDYLHEQGLMQRSTTLDGVAYTQPGRYARFSRTPQAPRPNAPGLGEHTAELLTEAGISNERINELTAAGTVVVGGPLALHFTPPYR